MAQLSDFAGNVNFNAQHSPIGAFFSFTCGHFGTRGGFGLEIGKPAENDLYIGIKNGDRFSDAPLRCLPFYKGATSNEAARYVAETAGPAEAAAKPNVEPIEQKNIRRQYGWATDRWIAEDFEFTIYSPFGSIPDPAIASADEMRFALCPSIGAQLVVKNNSNQTRTAVVALNFNEPGWRALTEDQTPSFAWRDRFGVIAQADDDGAAPFLFCRWTVDQGLREPPAHQLGTTPGIGIEIPPGKTRRLRIGLAAFRGDVATTGLRGKYFYARYFKDISDVLSCALKRFDDRTKLSDALDQQLTTSNLSADQQFLIAHSTRSYYGSTQLLEIDDAPFWIVNEGEYCMMNTLDLSVDQVFWELKHNPWVVRNLLDNFVNHYSYTDEVKIDSQKRAAGGLSFAHDMGAHNNFSREGTSSYELPELTGCFSYMTAEQLCNWILTAATYVVGTNDVGWARSRRDIIASCEKSLLNRCGDAGIISRDSSRCGENGAEITTYDSLDHSLAQARNNLYMAVKHWASCLGLRRLLAACGETNADQWLAHADRAAAVVCKQAGGDGAIPAVFEKENAGFASRILPAIEGLVYPLVWNDLDLLDTNGRFKSLLAALKKHTLNLLNDPQRRNFFDDGGIKLSSTSNNSWMSKIAIFQHVARRVLKLDQDSSIASMFKNADAAHVKWQTDGSGYWACCDQIISGVGQASRYYPRVITTALWMESRRDRSAL